MYRVNCHSCGKPFDAEPAEECSCLHPVRSFRCPLCKTCFCAAPGDYASKFWADAPAALWEKRKRRSAGQELNASPELIQRPMVLFADDDPVGRTIARQVITTMGLGIAVAENGDVALTMARAYKPDIIVTDALMPKLDGREMARMVKDELPATKIIVITSVYKDPRYKYEALKTFRVDDYLSKPIKPADLRHIIVKYLPKGTVPAE
jgi:CheY-like chemotaxis protein